MGAEVTYSSDNAADGTFVRFVKLNTHPKVFEVHFVERRADDRGGYTVGDIEGYYKAVHAAKVHSPYCGFDTWFDNHIGVDMCNGMGACARARAHARAALGFSSAHLSRGGACTSFRGVGLRASSGTDGPEVRRSIATTRAADGSDG